MCSDRVDLGKSAHGLGLEVLSIHSGSVDILLHEYQALSEC